MNYPLRVGDTKRELRRTLRHAGKPMPLEEATAVVLRIVTPGGVEERTMSRGENTGEVYYRWQASDFGVLQPGTYTYTIQVTWPDGQGTVPTKGRYKISVEAAE